MSLRAIDESLLDAVGLRDLSPEMKADALAHLELVLDQRVLVRVLPALDALKRAELEELYQRGDIAGMASFFESNLPTFGAVAEEEFTAMTAELAADVAIESALADAEPYYGPEFDELDGPEDKET
jgi:hypothetical protein